MRSTTWSETTRCTRLVLGLCLGAITLGGCGALIGHAWARDVAEDLTAHDYVVSMAEAEQAVRTVYESHRIVTNDTTHGTKTVVTGRDPNDLRITTTIRQLNNGVVRVSCIAGTYTGTLVPEAETTKLAQTISQAIASVLQDHALGTAGSGSTHERTAS